MMTYLALLSLGLFGVAVMFLGRRSEPAMIIGGALYGIAIFAAAIHSLHGGTP